MNENPTQPIQIVDKAPKWKSQNVNNWAAKFRGKTNSIITDAQGTHDTLFSKSVKRVEGQRDNVEGLQRELYFLEKLKDTGITPEPVTLKINPDRTDAQLLMKKLEGDSFEKTDGSDEVAKRNFGRISESVSQSLEAIHNRGVLVVDINEGTFVIQQMNSDNQDLITYVVDFELAEDIADLSSSEVQDRLKRWYSRKDIGLQIAMYETDFNLNVDTTKGVEQYLGAKSVVEHFIGPDYSWKIDYNKLSAEDRDRYDAQLQIVQPRIEEITKKQLREEYQYAKQVSSKYLPPDEETYVKREFEERLHAKIDLAMINITLPYFLHDKGISVETSTLKHLQRSLSLIVEERPTLGREKQRIVDRINEGGNTNKVLADIAA